MTRPIMFYVLLYWLVGFGVYMNLINWYCKKTSLVWGGLMTMLAIPFWPVVIAYCVTDLIRYATARLRTDGKQRRDDDRRNEL